MSNKTPSYIVTATPPTPNGDLHIGHLSGPYLGADIFCRYHNHRGNLAVLISSSDANQTYVVTTAEEIGADPDTHAKRFHDEIGKTLSAMDLRFDAYNYPDARHYQIVQEFFGRLYDKGCLIEKEVPVFFDPTNGRNLFEAYVGGRCPECLEETRGGICECCGHPNDPFRLILPYAVGNRELVLQQRTTKALFLPVEAYREQISDYYTGKKGQWRPHLIHLVEELLEKPLADYPLSYTSDWGVPVQFPGFVGQVYNVWAEMLPGFFRSTELACRERGLDCNAKTIWSEDGGWDLVQFLGYDNSYFFAIVHVALLFAADCAHGKRHIKANTITTNEFYLLDNFKFSTSMNHAIWGRDLLKNYTVDTCRFYFCRSNPETQQANFTISEMEDGVDVGLLRPFQRLRVGVNALLTDAGSSSLEPPSEEAMRLISTFVNRMERAYELKTISLRAAAQSLTTFLNTLGEMAERGKESGNSLTVLNDIWHGLGALCACVAPMMPDFSVRLGALLGLDEHSHWEHRTPTKSAKHLPTDLITLTKL